jgi:hypothetical protein
MADDKAIQLEFLDFIGRIFGISFLFEILEKCSESGKKLDHLNFVENANDFGYSKNYIKEQTISQYTYNLEGQFFKILNWSKSMFQNNRNLLEIFLMQVDGNHDSFLNYVLKKCEMTDRFFCKIYKFFIENFYQDFIRDFLLIENNDHQNFLNIICERDQIALLNVLSFLYKYYDQEFLLQLINKDLMKNFAIKNWFKFKLNIDLYEDQVKLDEKTVNRNEDQQI